MTTDWFDEVLTNSGVLDGTKVTAVHIEPVTGGVIARMMRARLTYSADRPTAPVSVIVKYPTDDPGSLGVAQAMGLYEQEVRFYSDIAPLVPAMSIPTCYLAEVDDSGTRFSLVLEDFGGRAVAGDAFTGSTPRECSDTLEQLVNFQAPLWNSPKVTELEWLANPARTHAVFALFSQGLPVLLDRFGNGLAPEHVRLFEAVLPKAGQWALGWAAPTVVQHGDFRNENTLLATAPGAPPVTVIDFQTVRLAPPGLDPAHFLCSSLSTAARRESERDLIAEYHGRLVAAGVSGFDFDACWDSYREGALYAVFLFAGMAGQVESTERGDRLIVEQLGRYADMALDLDSAEVAGLA
jgi:aminoglycoside phosphotransferase (APT) family kinase protein